MKGLTLSIALLLSCSTLSFAEQTLESYISTNKQEQYSFDYEKVKADSSKLRDSWISPLMLQYTYSKSDPYDVTQTSQNAAIKMDQAIFQFGGIYYGIKFTDASEVYSNLFLDVAKRTLAKQTVSLLIQIKQMDLKIQKQKLLIKNAEITLDQQKEEYLNGQLDSGFLDNAVISRNVVISALYDLQTLQQRLITQFETMSDLDYKTLDVPHLELMSEESFMKNNLSVRLSESEIQKNRYNKNVVMSKYFPRISVTAGYNWSRSEDSPFTWGASEKNYYDLGLKVVIPLDINTFVDIESARVDFLKSKIVVEDKKKEVKAIFTQVMQNIENFEKKRVLTQENGDIYKKLLQDTKELYGAGYKTKYDVELLQNSLDIQEIDAKVFDLDKELEILTLYEIYKNGN